MALTNLGNNKFLYNLAGEEVEIGDLSTSKFQGCLNLGRFQRERFVKILFPSIGTLSPIVSGDKISVDIGQNYRVILYPKAPDSQNDLGSYEFEIILKKRPPISTLRLSIDTSGLDFFYQPILTLAERTPTMMRSPEVDGSYAVYHSTKTVAHRGLSDGNKYRAGKAFHIYRPKLTDALGNISWANLTITAGELSIEADPIWLNLATYPVIIDPTFGYTTAGATSDWWDPNEMHGYRFTAPADMGTADSISVYARDSGELRKGVIVLQSTLAIIPNGVSNAITLPTDAAWASAAFATPPSPTASTDHILASVGNASSVLYWDTGTTDYGIRDSTNSYTTPTNPTDAVLNTNKFSIYVTYTIGGGGGLSIPVAMHHYKMMRL